MITQNMLEKYAKLAVRRGVNVQEGQPLLISASVRDYEFVRMCVKEAYKAGAKWVSVEWRDAEITKDQYTYESKETLSNIPDWVHDKVKYSQDEGACRLSIVSDAPGGLKDVDQEKIHAYQMAYHQKTADLQRYYMANEGQWSVLGLPSLEWAKVVFPDDEDEVAFEKLGDAIFAVSHVTEDNDPIEAWIKHDEVLINHAKKLTDYQFKALHFKSELGTDLTVELVDNHIWVGGGDYTPKGVYFDPNIPTEEVFSMPRRDGVEGIVYASKPLSYMGKIIDEFWLRFEKGKVVDFGAKKGQDLLQQLLDFDEGSRHLGEVALVPYDSPISKMGFLFYNTLYDENAACHLALGRPYPENLEGGVNMSEEELKEHGANDSFQHEDFMFGTEKMEVDGILADSTTVSIFREGNFVF